MIERVTRISYMVAYFSVLFFLIFLLKWYLKGMLITGAIVLLANGIMFICMLVDLIIQNRHAIAKFMRRRINMFLELFAGLVFIFSLLYIFGQAGAMDLNQISLKQGIVRTSIALVILRADAVLINYLRWKEERD